MRRAYAGLLVTAAVGLVGCPPQESVDAGYDANIGFADASRDGGARDGGRDAEQHDAYAAVDAGSDGGASPDTGAATDTGATTDAGRDAGPATDTGATTDAGRDAGPATDTGATTDAGRDAGRDAGPTTDTGATPDAGRDAGSDAGRDAGPAMDSGPLADAGADAPVAADAGRDAFMFDAGMCTPATYLVINEIDYDQTGTDTAEFIELYNPTSAPISLSGYVLVVINGSSATGPEYARIALTGTIAAGGFAVYSASGSTVSGSLASFGMAIQNGSPDGVLLLNGTTLVDAVIYGTMGSMATATLMGGATVTIPTPDAVGADTITGSLVRLPNGCDRGSFADWAVSAAPSPGAAN